MRPMYQIPAGLELVLSNQKIQILKCPHYAKIPVIAKKL